MSMLCLLYANHKAIFIFKMTDELKTESVQLLFKVQHFIVANGKKGL